MKRSVNIRLALVGTITSAALVGCERSGEPRVSLSPGNTYTNNHYVRGAGYYHAPYQAWFPFPYNSYTPGRGYYHGGQWASAPGVAAVEASHPTPSAVSSAQSQHDAARTSTRRHGFGHSSRFSGS